MTTYQHILPGMQTAAKFAALLEPHVPTGFSSSSGIDRVHVT